MKDFKTEDFIRDLIRSKDLINEANRNLTKIGMNMDTPITREHSSDELLNLIENQLSNDGIRNENYIRWIRDLRKNVYDQSEIMRALDRESYD